VSALFIVSIIMAYQIRLFAIMIYGRLIHEFDPWFNMRATQYLADNGAEKFFTWYDHESWYPLGRPVGTTIYPGMQVCDQYSYSLFMFELSFRFWTPRALV
jgi:dolichyl-diphosphooligosaccharide--protein glycosyltransferase